MNPKKGLRFMYLKPTSSSIGYVPPKLRGLGSTLVPKSLQQSRHDSRPACRVFGPRILEGLYSNNLQKSRLWVLKGVPQTPKL